MAELLSIECLWRPDDDADTSWLEQDDFEDRLAAYNRGDFGFVGCQAVAQILVTSASIGTGIVQTIRSGGLWGIESDSDDEYRAEVETDQLAELRAILSELGIRESQAELGIRSEGE